MTGSCKGPIRPFPRYVEPLFQNESRAKPFIWKWVCFVWKRRNIFIWMVLHGDSIGHKGKMQLRNDLFKLFFILTSFRFLGSFEIQVKTYLISTDRPLENLKNKMNSKDTLFTKQQMINIRFKCWFLLANYSLTIVSVETAPSSKDLTRFWSDSVTGISLMDTISSYFLKDNRYNNHQSISRSVFWRFWTFYFVVIDHILNLKVNISCWKI